MTQVAVRKLVLDKTGATGRGGAYFRAPVSAPSKWLWNSQKVYIAIFFFLYMIHVCIHNHVYANVGQVCACGDGSQGIIFNKYSLPQPFQTGSLAVLWAHWYSWLACYKVPEILLSPPPLQV